MKDPHFWRTSYMRWEVLCTLEVSTKPCLSYGSLDFFGGDWIRLDAWGYENILEGKLTQWITFLKMIDGVHGDLWWRDVDFPCVATSSCNYYCAWHQPGAWHLWHLYFRVRRLMFVGLQVLVSGYMYEIRPLFPLI